MNYNKILILENDIEKQGLPYDLKCLMEVNANIPYEVWWWFRYDVLKNTAAAFKRFASIDANTLCVSSPSFAGQENRFEGFLKLFHELMKMNIKVRLAVMYSPDFYWYLIKWMDEIGSYVGAQKAKDKEIKLLKECLDFHEIYNIVSDDAIHRDMPLENCMYPITWEELEKNYFKNGSTITLNNKSYKVRGVYIDMQELPKSTINVEKKLPSGSWTTERILISTYKGQQWNNTHDGFIHNTEILTTEIKKLKDQKLEEYAYIFRSNRLIEEYVIMYRNTSFEKDPVYKKFLAILSKEK